MRQVSTSVRRYNVLRRHTYANLKMNVGRRDPDALYLSRKIGSVSDNEVGVVKVRYPSSAFPLHCVGLTFT